MIRLYYLILKICYLFCRFLPIDEKQIVFESEGDFSDNSRALYDYMTRNIDGYHYTWLVHNKDYSSLVGKNTKFLYHSYRFHALSDILVLARAKYLFFTHGFGSFLPRKEQLVVNLWHGIPLKAPKLAESRKNKKPSFNYLLCLSEANASFVAKFLNCDVSYTRPFGYPRNDLLFMHKDIGAYNPFAPMGFDGKVIIWMPTFRKSGSKLLSEEECDNETGLPLLGSNELLLAFNNFLKTIHVCIIVKVHHLQAEKETFKHNLSNIIFVQDTDIISKGIQLYEVIAKTDALITDYSSVFFDYLLMDRPIGFILDDLETYEKSRGAFLYNPVTDLLAGNHIYKYDQLVNFCKEIAEEVDSTKDIRNEQKKIMIKYQDGNTCMRIVDFLKLKETDSHIKG